MRSVSDPDLDPDTSAGLYAEVFTFAKNEAYSREIAFHTMKGSRANLRVRDPESGWCFKNSKPVWGYTMKHVPHGVGACGTPINKSIWVLDETMVSGKPLHEWVRYCLVELAMKGASCRRLRNFCTDQGIPGRNGKYWNYYSWKDLLYDYNIMKYAGIAVWNVRGQDVKRKPISEWEIVENAHPAIITIEEAKEIIRVRRELSKKYPAFSRSQGSVYLLSGGGIEMREVRKEPGRPLKQTRPVLRLRE